MTRIRAVLAFLTVMIIALGASFAARSSGLPESRVVETREVTSTTLQLGPVASAITIVPVCADTPVVDLDPDLLATGPEVSVVQTLLNVRSDGTYGPLTASAVAAVSCPDLGTLAALQSLSEAVPALRDQAAARIAQIAAQAASRAVQQAAAPVVSAPAPVTGDCWGTNQYAAYIYQHESGCRTDAVNGGGCAGLGQACPGSKMPCSLSDAPCQLGYFESYALGRYGSWEAAYNFWINNHWW